MFQNDRSNVQEFGGESFFSSSQTGPRFQKKDGWLVKYDHIHSYDIPYHPCMIYLLTWMVDFYGKRR